MHKKFTLTILSFFLFLGLWAQGGNTNEWTVKTNSIVDNCNSITFSFTVSSPSTSKDLSHATFGFPVDASARNKNPGSTVWSFGNDGSYSGQISGIPSLSGIKDDGGGNKGTSYTYTFTFSGTNYTTIKTWLAGNPNLVIMTKAGTQFNAFTTKPSITTPCNTECFNPLAPTQEFNVFLENGATLITNETEGPIAMGGNLTFGNNNNYQVAIHSAGSFRVNNIPVGFLINGRVFYNSGNQIQVNNGNVKIGNGTGSTVWYKDNNNAATNIQITSGNFNANPRIHLNNNANTLATSADANPIIQGGLVNFSDAFSALRANATTLSNCANNATLTNPNGGAIGNTNLPNQVKINLNNGINVLNVSGADLNNVSVFTFNNKPNANRILVVNVNAPGTFNWNVWNQAGIGGSDASYVIYNFYNTTTLNINGNNNIWGTVFAPSADIVKTVNQSNIDGQVVGKSFMQSGGEVHYYRFLGCITPCTVAPPPCVPPTVAALTGNNSVCVGTGTTFATSTAGGTFESSNPFVATVHPTTGVVTTLNAGSAEIRYTVTNAPGCATTVTRLLTVNAIPAKPTISASAPNICNGNPTILTATSAATGSTYRWYLNNTLINGQSGATLSVTTPGSYSVEIVSPATCASERSDATVLTALSTPTLNGAITGNNTVCEGASTTLSHATAGGTWSSSDATIASVSSTGVVTGVAGGSVTITYTVSNACGSNSVSFPMNINPLPAQPAIITGNTQICINGTTTLASATAGGVWSSTNTYLATVNPSTGVVTGHVGGTLNIVYTVTNSCGSSSRQVSVTISAAPPTPDAIQGVATVCAGSTTTYTSATAGGTWSSSNNAVATVNTATGVVTGVSNGTAIITYTVNGTCGSSQVTKSITVTNCGGGGNQNEWSATLDSVVDLCDSIRFVLTVKSPLTSKDLSHVTFGFPVNTNNKTRAAGNAIWSFGQDGSYNTGDITGVNAPFIGIKDDNGEDAGVTLTYTFTFSGNDYNRMLNWVLSDTNLVVLMKAGATPNGGFTALVVNPSVTQGCGVSGGSGGGIESYSLGEVIGKRNMAKAKAGQLGETNYGATPKWDGPVSNDRGGIQMQGTNMRLRDLIPSQVPGLQAFVTSPTDLTQFTNAVEVMSVDFTRSNVARAVTFATKTMDEVYNHTKPICDRLRGAQLLDVQKITLANNVDMLSYTIRQANGKVEYAVSFSAGAKAGRNNLNIESKWFTKDYVNDEVMYNFQVWAETPALMRSLTEDILSRLNSNGVLVQARNNAVVPEVYVVSGVRTGGKLILNIENRTPNSNGYFELDEKLNEQANVTKRRVPFTINQQGRSTLEIEMRDGFESDVRMYINGEITDLVYMSDGIWGLDYNRNQTTIRSFRVTNDPARVYKDEYPLFRDIQIEGTTSDYITAYKFLRGAALPANISAYKSLRFEASGGHKLKITLVKEGIAQWNDQYTYTLQLDPQKKEYQISLGDFASKGVAGKIRANDVTTVVFSIEATGANTAVNATIGKVGFTKTDVDYLRSLEAKDVQLFPNPSEGRFTIQFRSPVEMPLTVKLTDAATGRPVMSRAIQAIQGENQVTMEMNAQQQRSQGVYIVHLEGANGVRYKPAKLSVTSKNR